MGSRLQLNNLLSVLLEAAVPSAGPNVYFQPPSNIVMKYPALVYELDDIHAEHADNHPYRLLNRYQVTIIDRTADTPIQKALARLPSCRFNRRFSANGLNHTVFTLYF